MNHHRTEFHVASRSKMLGELGATGVSLHCHSMYSMEMLDFIPVYAKKLPFVAARYMEEEQKYLEREGRQINFETAHWSPPLTPQEVYDSEKARIEADGLNAIVSITDHDQICGNFEIAVADGSPSAPISLEWTVPFEYGFFHLGVHNLPNDDAESIKVELLNYTFNKEAQTGEELTRLFALLNDIPDVLLVFNHPLWDIEIVGQERHEELLNKFLQRYRRWINAIEVNGFRSWSENKAAIELARDLDLPVVSGGDRHACQANTVINVTDAGSFNEFVTEVRKDKRSQVAFLPEYNHPLVSRQLKSFSEILSFYPDAAEDRRRWFDRVFFDNGDGRGSVPLSSHGWERGGPIWLRFAINTLGVLGRPYLRPAFSMLRRRKDVLPTTISAGGETTQGLRSRYPAMVSETL